MAVNIMQEKQIYGALSVYREQGYYLTRLEQYEKAKASYDEAYNSAPDNARNLIGRSQVCANAFRPLQAYADAKLALELEPTNMNAVNVQARALYSMSDFEHSVVMNYRGAQIRQQPPYFKEGINQGFRTIQECIGTDSGNVMLDFLPLLKRQESISIKMSAVSKPSHICRIPLPAENTRLTQAEARKYLILSRVLAMKYLGPMAYDKFFLEKLIKNRGLKSANAHGSEQILSLVKQALDSLVESQEMLRTQRPYYTIKLAEKSESKRLNKFKKSILNQERLIATKIAERLHNELKDCLKNHRVKDLIIKAERFQQFLDSKSVKTLPDKNAYIDRLYRLVGEAYLSQHRLSHKLSHKSNRRRIAFLMGLSYGRPTSFDSVIMNAPQKPVDLKLVTEKVIKSLDLCEHPVMRCWLTYELARLLCMQRNFAQSKFYAKKCQREAHDITSTAWWLNGCFVLLSGDLRQGNAAEVQLQIEEALKWSKGMQDPEQVQEFLTECARMAAEPIIIDDRKIIKRRENRILSVMNEEQRTETEVLFKRMSVVPRGRRFSVQPNMEDPKTSKSVRYKSKQKGLSVVTGVDKGIPQDPKSDIAGYQNFNL